ncbi:MAG TPA: ABC transporter ATP-binding protein [Longimicrobiales bacterium]|nr:ABC transporter ATP-binding protein [Longimicrobiales bacterium]
MSEMTTDATRDGTSDRAPVLEIENLRTRFDLEAGTVRPVDGVTFSIAPGETVGLVGESGAGKSMTALSILGLVPPPGRLEEGSRIRYTPPRNGPALELVGATKSELRKLRGDRVAMIFQEPMTSLNPVQRVGAQIDEALRLHRGLDGAAARSRSIGLLGEVGVPEPEARYRAYPHELSGGMRQRVMIAMALACEPDLLIADEPTTALDVTIQAQILDLLASLQERHGMAILLVTHDLAVVAEVCDRVMVMYGGQLVESGSVAEVFANPLHPYTRGLMDSLPTGDGRPLRPIPGRVPAAGEWPEGCRFAPRCRWAADRCAEPQQLVEVEDGRGTRCGRVSRGEIELEGLR